MQYSYVCSFSFCLSNGVWIATRSKYSYWPFIPQNLALQKIMQILRPAVQVTKLNTKIPPSFQLQIYGDCKQEFLLYHQKLASMSLHKKMSCFGFTLANYDTSKRRTLATERLKTSLLLLCSQWVLCIFYAAFVQYAPPANASYAWNSIDPVFGGFSQDKNIIKNYYTRKVYFR